MWDVLGIMLKILIVVGITQGAVAYLILVERKIAAWAQDRIGPNRAGPFGLIQPLADGAKMILKEDVIPSYVSKPLYILAPMHRDHRLDRSPSPSRSARSGTPTSTCRDSSSAS